MVISSESYAEFHLHVDYARRQTLELVRVWKVFFSFFFLLFLIMTPSLVAPTMGLVRIALDVQLSRVQLDCSARGGYIVDEKVGSSAPSLEHCCSIGRRNVPGGRTRENLRF